MSDKDEVYQKLLQLKPKEFSIEYTAEAPEDLAIVMSIVDENIISFYHYFICIFGEESSPIQSPDIMSWQMMTS